MLIEFHRLGELSRSLMEQVFALNQKHASELSVLTMPELVELVTMSACSVASVDAGVLGGFVIALDEEAPYASPNYRWFGERFDSFLYIDRIAVDGAMRNRAIGRSLYAYVAEHARQAGKKRLCCEVNVVPENLRSLAFHRALGFRWCGRRVYPDGEREVAMHTLVVSGSG